jgi:hypothetical protein
VTRSRYIPATTILTIPSKQYKNLKVTLLTWDGDGWVAKDGVISDVRERPAPAFCIDGSWESPWGVRGIAKGIPRVSALTSDIKHIATHKMQDDEVHEVGDSHTVLSNFVKEQRRTAAMSSPISEFVPSSSHNNPDRDSGLTEIYCYCL